MYKTKYGLDWPKEMPDPFIGLTVGKKWRELEAAYGIKIDDPWVPMLDAAKSLLSSEYFSVSRWTEEHFHDFVMHDKLVIWGCASSSKSNDIGLLLLLDWMVDPFQTVTLLGSTTKADLKSRSWEAIVRYHNALKICNRGKYLIPGKISKQGQALVNVEDSSAAESAGEKAGIQGRALNEDGRLQGAHAPYVRLVVDELAEITNHEAIKTAMANLRVGTKSFKFIGMANPESWDNPSCLYCVPEGGINSVDVDTGTWVSTFGCFVRHHDGMKSPVVQNPKLRSKFPYLLSGEEVELTIKEAGGNPDAPQVWKMIRGFPVPSGNSAPVVLDKLIAKDKRIDERTGVFNPSELIGVCAGIDPAWSSGGDKAVRARCRVIRGEDGIPILDFTDGVKRLVIEASSKDPPVLQLRRQVIAAMREPYEAPFRNTAVDASANQGLADDLKIYAGADCLGVNSSVRASDSPIRANDTRKACETLYDRGTEAWCVLAEFCKAGMVRGLPDDVVRALTTRRFAMKRVKGEDICVSFPLRLEDKRTFKRRSSGPGGGYGHSPDEADACALAALAVKERLGVVPFGGMPVMEPEALLTDSPIMMKGPVVYRSEEYATGFDDLADGYTADYAQG